MLIPRFTIRGLLLAMGVSGVISLVLSAAMKGQAWAVAMSLALGMLPLVFAMYATAFLVAWVCSQLSAAMAGNMSQPRGNSPFAISGPPKQIVPPQEMD